jgi:hypothetical protein
LAPYNTSFFTFYPGKFNYLWEEFDLDRANYVIKKYNYVGSDQAWIAYNLGHWRSLYRESDGIYRIDSIEPGRETLEGNVRLVFFPGGPAKKPWENEIISEHPWISQYYPFHKL